MKTPTIGRIVHYTKSIPGVFGQTTKVCAAIITSVEDDAGAVTLFVLGSARAEFVSNVHYTDKEAGDTEAIDCWSWPQVDT